VTQVNNPEPFLLRQLASLEADLDRYGRILDALRLKFMRDHGCSDIEAEMLLLEDADAKQIRRQQNQARRHWQSFNRALDKHRKAKPAPESSEVARPEKPAAPAPTPQPAPPPPAASRPEPETHPIL
jgi:hypothetical protein